MIKCNKCGSTQSETNQECFFCGADLRNQQTSGLNDTSNPFDDHQSDFGTDNNRFPDYSRKQRQNNHNTKPILVLAVCIVAVTLVSIATVLSLMQTQTPPVPEQSSQNVPDTNSNTPSEYKSLFSEFKPSDPNPSRIDIFSLKHEMIIDEIKKIDNIVSLNAIDTKSNPENVLDDLTAKLVENKNCYENSEDFVIRTENDLETFQTALKEINYKKLFKSLADKHTNGGVCKNTKPTAAWLSSSIAGTQMNPRTNQRERNHVLYCSNEVFYTNNSLLDINLEYYYSIFEVSGNKSMFVSLGWETGDVGLYRFFEPYDTMDSYVLMGFDGLLKAADLPTQEYGKKVLLLSKYEENLSLLDSLMQSDDFKVVYGRYVKSDDGGYYFVISYRKYTLKEMHEKCPFVKNEYEEIRYGDTLNPRPRDSKVDLPF